MKGFVVSGDISDEILSLLGCGNVSRILGVNWSPPTDEFWVTVKINVSRKHRGVHTEEDLTFEEIPRLLMIALTRRICQGIVYSCYDIYGLVGPITITLKISLRDLFSKELNLSWDDPIPEELKKKWIKMLQVVKTVEQVRFRRCIKPDDPVVGKPILILCKDAQRRTKMWSFSGNKAAHMQGVEKLLIAEYFSYFFSTLKYQVPEYKVSG